MGIVDESSFIELFKFFNGQRLFAEDMQGLDDFNREMRQLHNASLHQFGIGAGYIVSGLKGERAVTVEPGYALDVAGHEIVNTQQQTLQVPPVSADEKGRSVFYDLTVAYQETGLEEVEFQDGLCDTRGAVRLRDAPVFCWVRLQRDDANNLTPEARFVKDIQEGKKIILTRIEVLNCQLQQVISIAQRPSARPECGPRIVCGAAVPTGWKNIDLSNAVTAGQQLGFLAFQAEIDTTAANFQITPCYSADIPAARQTHIVVDQTDEFDVLLVDIFRVLDPQPDCFQAFLFVFVIPFFSGGVIMSPPAVGGFNEGAGIAAAPANAAAAAAATGLTLQENQAVIDWITANWNVSWMGVEG